MATTNPAAPATPLAPPDSSRIAQTVANHLPFRGAFASLTPLAGDASNRRYFRVTLKGTPSSLILMQLADPEALKKSEEAVGGAPAQITELPFTNVLTHLHRTGVTVPQLHYYDREAGLCFWKISATSRWRRPVAMRIVVKWNRSTARRSINWYSFK